MADLQSLLLFDSWLT